MSHFFELLVTRRSIRKYLSTPIEEEKIQMLTHAALMSPASKRSNPWEFIMVQNSDMLEKLSESRIHATHPLKGAPLGIVIIADTNKSDIWIEDASISATIIQMQAHDLGLGSCWLQIYNRQKDETTSAEEYVRGLLNIPSHYAVLNIISIGYPDEQKKPFEMDKLAIDKIHMESFQ